MQCFSDVFEKTSTSMFLTMFFKTQNIVPTMHLTMLIAHPYVVQPLWEVGGLPKRLHSKWSPVGWVSPQLVESRQSFRVCECQPSVDVEFQYFFKSPLAALWQLYARFRVQAHDIGFSEPLPNHKPISSVEDKEVTLTKWMPCGKVWW